MSYRLSKRNQRRKITAVIGIILALSLLFYLRMPIYSGLAKFFHIIARPVWKFESNLADRFNILFSKSQSKESLIEENERLKARIEELENKFADRNVLAEENEKLKAALGRKESRNLVLASILSKPNRSFYDTLIVDAGLNEGIAAGDRVFAGGDVFIGTVESVFPETSKIKLLSTPGEKLDVILSGRDIYLQASGLGGGNFEISLARGIEVLRGASVILPGLHPFVVGTAEEIVVDPRNPLQRIILRSPVNIQELRFVEIEKQP
jgi:cell shape-determining protein MreC